MPVLDKDRTPLGTFKSQYEEPMTSQLCIRIPKSVAEKLNKLPNKTQFVRDLVVKAVEKLDDE